MASFLKAGISLLQQVTVAANIRGDSSDEEEHPITPV